MTNLSVNLNKIALLRNSRGRDYPNVVDFARRFVDLGVQGITVHPRQDERHIKRQDTRDLASYLADIPEVEFNVEGYPSPDFMELIEETRPDQCTLVPDATDQLTSDHGWDVERNQELLVDILDKLKTLKVRSALFIDPDVDQIKAAGALGYDRIELYTESYAQAYGTNQMQSVLSRYADAVTAAKESGLEINAGHDLDLKNLEAFLELGDILEVSIGHALTIECILMGIDKVTTEYLKICELG